jgi:hypothetical protein
MRRATTNPAWSAAKDKIAEMLKLVADDDRLTNTVQRAYKHV